MTLTRVRAPVKSTWTPVTRAEKQKRKTQSETDYRLTSVKIMKTSLLEFGFFFFGPFTTEFDLLERCQPEPPYKVIMQSLENPLAAG